MRLYPIVFAADLIESMFPWLKFRATETGCVLDALVDKRCARERVRQKLTRGRKINLESGRCGGCQEANEDTNSPELHCCRAPLSGGQEERGDSEAHSTAIDRKMIDEVALSAGEGTERSRQMRLQDPRLILLGSTLSFVRYVRKREGGASERTNERTTECVRGVRGVRGVKGELRK